MRKALLLLLFLSGCAADAAAVGPEVVPTVLPAVAPAPGEVRAAYRSAWSAYRDGGTSGFSASALVLARRRALPARRGPIEVRLVDADTAVVSDATSACTLRREGGSWHVTEAAAL